MLSGSPVINLIALEEKLVPLSEITRIYEGERAVASFYYDHFLEKCISYTENLLSDDDYVVTVYSLGNQDEEQP